MSTASSNSRLDAIIASYLEAIERGQQPDRQQLLAAHAEDAESLAKFFGDLDKVEATKLQAQQVPHVTFVPQHEPKPGTIFGGRYKLLENIGEGGMGSVWVAEQQQPVKRRVAIKLVKAGMDSKQVLARFEAERQALAVMDHPNIAKVFDGGMTEQGRPYFVMEYVKGVPFTEYCDKARLSLRERLNLFIPVCQAVQHAHHKGIVHRDLKPSNILICLYDGKPVPKVIDFGLAKAMHQSLTDQSIYTGHGIMVGTPLYMSPEQAEHNNLDVDTRTDIYSLGVVLYELLVGTTPLERQQLQQAAFEEVLRLIKEVEPPRPSLRLSTSASLPSIAAQRSIDPKQLSRSVAGDLDWIVMKSLEKERSRRYETAAGLARDIERFLNDEAVEACPPSRTYRLKKFLRKHRGQVIAASAVLLALIVGIAGTTIGMYQAIRAERASKLANQKLERYSDTLLQAMEELHVETSLASGLIEKEGKGKSSEDHGDFGFTAEFENGKIVKSSSWISPDADADAARTEMAQVLRSSLIHYVRQSDRNLTESVKNLETANATLARSLIHSIGYGEDPAPPELKSLADWSTLTDSNLKLRTVEVALEDPETAIRIARRAEQVTKACVGLSPTRRDKAVELISVKQRDMTVDPRVRIAACWLAIALGSADVPALQESVLNLSDAKNGSIEHFAEFLRFALQSHDPEIQKLLAQQLPELLFSILEKSTNGTVLAKAQRAIADLAPNLDSSQTMKAWHSATQLLDRASVDFDLMSSDLPTAIGAALAAIAQRLKSDDHLAAWHDLIEALKKMERHAKLTHGSTTLASPAPLSATTGLDALAPILLPAYANRCWIDVVEIVKASRDENLQKVVSGLFPVVAPHLEQTEVRSGWIAMIELLANSPNQQVQWEASKTLSILAPRLNDDMVTSGWDSLVAFVDGETGTDDGVDVGRTLAILAPRLKTENATAAWYRLVELSENHRNSTYQEDIGRCLSALAVKIPDADLTTCWESIVPKLKLADDGTICEANGDGIIALAPRIDAAQRSMALNGVLDDFQNRKIEVVPVMGFYPTDLPFDRFLASLGPYLDVSQVHDVWNRLIQIVGRRGECNPTVFGESFLTFGPRLTPKEISTTFDQLIEIPSDADIDELNGSEALFWGIAAQLDATQFGRSADGLRKFVENSNDGIMAGHALQALQRRLPHVTSAEKTWILKTAKTTLESSEDPSNRQNAIELLVAATMELDKAEAGRTADTLIRVMESSEEPDVQSAAANGLAAIAKRLDRSQVMKACDATIKVMRKSSSLAALILSNRLSSMLQQLNADERPLFALGAIELLLEFNLRSRWAFQTMNWMMMGPFETNRFGFTTKALSDPRAIGRLLCHPGCIDQPRELLLQRFEELVLHDGKHVFLTMTESDAELESSDSPTPHPDMPPRKFHTVYDAAAWIQTNWPDFDLEASHPVTWRGER